MSDCDASLLEQRIQSLSEIGNPSELTALLRKVLVLEPLQQPDVSVILNDPWFVDSSSPAASPVSATE